MMHQLLDRLLDGHAMTDTEAESMLIALANETVAPPLAGALLAALRSKGETADEVRGLAAGMRAVARRPHIPPDLGAVDIVGTGGDHSGSFNLSTAAALLAGAAGIPVVKHGNRSISSKCGSADVLTALGVPLPDTPEAAETALADTGFAFLFAPHFHPAMKSIAGIRRAMGVRTVFNILGPLTNPAEPPYAVIGAFDRNIAALMADVLSRNGFTRRAFVVHSTNGWDEATPVAPFHLFDVRPDTVTQTVRDPADVGLARCEPDALTGDDATTNADAMRAVFHGAPGAHRDAVVLGAALAIEVVDDGGLTPADALSRAQAVIDDGRAERFLARMSHATDGSEIEHV